jgi:hypothetical protein
MPQARFFVQRFLHCTSNTCFPTSTAKRFIGHFFKTLGRSDKHGLSHNHNRNRNSTPGQKDKGAILESKALSIYSPLVSIPFHAESTNRLIVSKPARNILAMGETP